MGQARVIVIRTAGVNCDEETAYAWKLAGAEAELVHIDALIENPQKLQEAQILTVAGGFSYGDDVAAGKILGNQIRLHLNQEISRFIEDGKLILGICNGFQVLMKAGVLPGLQDKSLGATLMFNDSSKYEARWVHLRVESNRCAFLPEGKQLRLPVAHAEGKIVVSGPDALDALRNDGHIALKYADEKGQACDYPLNPNGSVDGIAGLTDSTGQVLGLMPHPERFVHRTQDPLWTNNKAGADAEGDGMILFHQAAARFK